MPESLSGILILAAVIGLAVLWSWIKGRANKALNRHVFDAGTYRNHKELVEGNHTVVTPLAPEDYIARLVERCGFARPGETRRFEATGRFVELRRVDTAVEFGYQTGLVNETRILVSATSHDNGSLVEMQIHNWMESDGVMMGAAEFQKLWRTIQALARENAVEEH